jgi:transglutaminase-like putative cysteine protease
MLIPRATAHQTIRQSHVTVDPMPEVRNEYEDFFGNKVLYFAIQHAHAALTVTVVSEVAKKPGAPEIDLYGNMEWEEVKRQLTLPGQLQAEVLQYIPETNMTASSEEILKYALISFTPRRPLLEAAHDLMKRIYKDFQFQPGFTTIATPLTVVMQERKGVCQDFAHLGIACLRSIGLPARYVSGYIETLAPEGKEKLTGVDASHAWFSVFTPGAGWIDFDPTNNQLAGDRHLVIGWGRDYADITPLKGIIVSSGPHSLSVSVDVKRIA